MCQQRVSLSPSTCSRQMPRTVSVTTRTQNTEGLLLVPRRVSLLPTAPAGLYRAPLVSLHPSLLLFKDSSLTRVLQLQSRVQFLCPESCSNLQLDWTHHHRQRLLWVSSPLQQHSRWFLPRRRPQQLPNKRWSPTSELQKHHSIISGRHHHFKPPPPHSARRREQNVLGVGRSDQQLTQQPPELPGSLSRPLDLCFALYTSTISRRLSACGSFPGPDGVSPPGNRL